MRCQGRVKRRQHWVQVSRLTIGTRREEVSKDRGEDQMVETERGERAPVGL